VREKAVADNFRQLELMNIVARQLALLRQDVGNCFLMLVRKVVYNWRAAFCSLFKTLYCGNEIIFSCSDVLPSFFVVENTVSLIFFFNYVNIYILLISLVSYLYYATIAEVEKNKKIDSSTIKIQEQIIKLQFNKI